jgi:hypothetical protein
MAIQLFYAAILIKQKIENVLINLLIKEQKKDPSAYNKFIKEQMTLLKNDGYNPKDRMRKATEEWKKQKNDL